MSSNTKRDKKRKDVASRTALSPRNIVEFSMEQCAKAVNRNKSLQTNILKTDSALLGRVFYVPPQKESK
jgi:hypothetical protein